MNWDHELDARGLRCPLPVLKAAKRLKSMAPGQVLHLLADDPAAIVDVPHYCSQSGHELVSRNLDGEDGVLTFDLRRRNLPGEN